KPYACDETWEVRSTPHRLPKTLRRFVCKRLCCHQKLTQRCPIGVLPSWQHKFGEHIRAQGPQCHAVARDARPVAPMVESTPIASRWHNAVPRTLAVSRPQARQAHDNPPAKPLIPRGSGCGWDQEEGNTPRLAAQFCDPPA